MVNQQMLQGRWNELSGKIRSRWGQLTKDDVATFNGDVDRLVGVIQSKTGEARESIEKFLEQLTAGGASSMGDAAETMRGYARRAVDTVQEGASQAADSMSEGYEHAEETIRENPMNSVLVCFGAGLLVGVVTSAMLRRS